MKKTITFLLFLLAATGANAQSKLSREVTNMLKTVNQQIATAQQQQPKLLCKVAAVTKECPVDTAAIQENMVVSFNADGTVKTVDIMAILAEGATCPTADLEARGIRVKDIVRKFVFLAVPTEQLTYLETLPEFVSLNKNAVYHTMSDNTRRVTHVSDINGIDNEAYTFDIPYTGKGVVVGIVDVGIDFNHIAFRDSEGKTRIKKAVYYTNSTSNATILTNPEDIAAISTGNTSSTHGTHVASTAAGSMVDATIDYAPGTRKLGGMAPEADIVLCEAKELSIEHITRCVEEITQTAQELNEPCVINFSFGATGGWHDGKSETNTIINNYEKEGIIFCMSAANDAKANWTVDKVIPAGGYLKFIPEKNDAIASSATAHIPTQDIAICLPQCTDPLAISYSFEVIDSITGQVTTLSETPLRDSDNDIYTPRILFENDTEHQNWLIGLLSFSRCHFDSNSKFLVVKFHNRTDSDLRAYAMSDRAQNAGHADSFAYTDFPNYEYDKGTADISMNDACSAKNFITVGAYTTDTQMTGYDGKTYSFSSERRRMGTPNSTAGFSSYGRDDYGRTYPDVIAPGTLTIAAYNSHIDWYGDVTDKQSWENQYICAYLTDSSNKTHLFYRDQGTSMAAPVVTGIVALWLQAYPKLNAEMAREIMAQTSHLSVNGENITATSGNTIQLGYGLIDAEAGMNYILKNLTPTDINSISDTNQSNTKATKKLINGKIIIEKNGKHYTLTGQATR